MRIKTGVDMLEISRLDKSLKNPRFLTYCFTEYEISEYFKRGYSKSFLAGCFCCKEAFSKVMGTGIRGFKLTDISVMRNSLGKPYFEFYGNAKILAEKSGLDFDVSITHTKNNIVAFVVGYSS